MAGFTTVQSVGALTDVAIRDAVARGIIAGPRVLTSIRQVTDTSATVDELTWSARGESDFVSEYPSYFTAV